MRTPLSAGSELYLFFFQKSFIMAGYPNASLSKPLVALSVAYLVSLLYATILSLICSKVTSLGTFYLLHLRIICKIFH